MYIQQTEVNKYHITEFWRSKAHQVYLKISVLGFSYIIVEMKAILILIMVDG